MPPAPARPGGDEIAAFLVGAGVPRDVRILDAPCGLGRRAQGLAERGFHVTAVDTNAVAVEALRRRATKRLGDRLVCRASTREAMPGLPSTERFRVILSLDHPLGRDDGRADVAFLGRLREHLAEDGLFLLEILHRDFFAARPRPFAYHVIGDVEQHEFRTFDPVSGRLQLDWRFYQREGEDLRYRGGSSSTFRLLAPHEIEALLEKAGWRVDAWYGGWGKEAVFVDRRKLLVAARPSARS